MDDDDNIWSSVRAVLLAIFYFMGGWLLIPPHSRFMHAERRKVDGQKEEDYPEE
jgi:hypothetical protein